MVPELLLALAPLGSGEERGAGAMDLGSQRRWIARTAMGIQSIADSDHQRLLELEGYGHYRALWQGSFDRQLSGPCFVGVFGLVALREDTPNPWGPELSERIWGGGLQIPLHVFVESGILSIVPRVGFTSGVLSLYDEGASSGALLLGGELVGVQSLTTATPTVGLGVALGIYYAPVPPPSEIGKSYDLGGAYLIVVGEIHG